jgi:hypothetical protein
MPRARSATSRKTFTPSLVTPYTLWLDDVQYEVLAPSEIGTVTASFRGEARTLNIGQKARVAEQAVSYALGGASAPVRVIVTPLYFTYASSNATVANVDGTGEATALAQGTADITATFAGAALSEKLALTVPPPLSVTEPPLPAPTPSGLVSNTIALYNSTGSYPNHPVDSLKATWSGVSGFNQAFALSGGGTCLQYAGLDFAGIEAYGPNAIDASGFEAISVDVWSADLPRFRIKLVNFGTANQEAEVVLDGTTLPKFETGKWVTLKVPFTAFTTLNPNLAFNNIQQIIFSSGVAGGGGTAFVDNILFTKH